MSPVIIGIIVIVVLLAVFIASKYNNFVVLRERVKKSWKDIDIQLKRRFDLIPNLLETVKGYSSHEKEIFTKVAELRSGYEKTNSVAEKGKISGELSSVLRGINVSLEAYPELKANENFRELQLELQNTEDKIAYARQFYNDITNRYNQEIKVFPGNIIAGLFKFEEAEYFETKDEQERENVKVKF